MFVAAEAAIKRASDSEHFVLIGTQMLAVLVDEIQLVQIQEHQAEYYSLVEKMLRTQNFKIKYEAQKAFIDLLKHIKDSDFNENWAKIFEYAWTEVLKSKNTIEKLGQLNLQS